MRIWTTNDFHGHWPVGVCAVVAAPTPKRAGELLEKAINQSGLKYESASTPGRDPQLIEFDLSKSGVVVLMDGDY